MDATRAARNLERWFRSSARDLPWRRGHEPYQILLAEFILQQTRMGTGVRYFEAILRKFPTIEALAAASEEEVLAAWSGLGYYRRARNLHATARTIVRQHAGRVPDDVSALLELPGIGPYSAGAIASIAYNRPATSVDGNQVRVLSRVLGIRTPETVGARRRIASLAQAMLENVAPRTVNQGLMDLGSAVCTPSSPDCNACPFSRACRTRGRVRRRARRPSRAPVEAWVASLWTRNGKVWLSEPRAQGLLAHLWLPPLGRAETRSGSRVIRHVFSHRTWTIRPVRRDGIPTGRGRWATLADLRSLPHSALTVKLMEFALGTDHGGR